MPARPLALDPRPRVVNQLSLPPEERKVGSRWAAPPPAALWERASSRTPPGVQDLAQGEAGGGAVLRDPARRGIPGVARRSHRHALFHRIGGEGGIRTHRTAAPSTGFQA